MTLDRRPRVRERKRKKKVKVRLDEWVMWLSLYVVTRKERERDYDEDKVEVVDKSPLECIVILVVDLGGGTFLDEYVLDEVVDG
jgi:hypothetical protein